MHVSPTHAIGSRFGLPPNYAQGAAARAGSRGFVWLVWIWLAFLLCLPLAILAGAEVRDRDGLLLAYVNVALIGSAMIYFVRRHNFAALVPVLFFIFLFFSWPIGSIFMGLFNPENRYILVDETQRRCLDGNVRLQLAVLVHVLCYLLVIALFAPRSNPVPDLNQHDGFGSKLGVLTALGAIFATGLHAVGQVTASSVLNYLAVGAFIYLNGFPFVVGALFPRIPLLVRVLLLAHLCVVGVFYLVGGGRTYALLPFFLLLLGLIFYSGYSQRIKFVVTALLLIGMPIAVVVGETTQRLTQTKGFERFEERAATLRSDWRQNLAQGSTVGRTLGRTFFTGGHSIVTLTPESYDYLAFVPGEYLREFITAIFIPGRIYGARHYSWTGQLKRYGFRISEKTSVELSLVGSLWLIGGWAPLILGSLAVGGLHAITMRWLNTATKASVYKGLFYLAMVAYAVFWAPNLDIIYHTRSLLLAGIAAWLIWNLVITPLFGSIRRAPAPRGFPASMGASAPAGASRAPRPSVT